MTRVRRPLLALVALFTAAITIDRIGVGRGSDAIASYVYALAALIVIAPLSIASLRHGRARFVTGVAVVGYAAVLSTTGWQHLNDIHVVATEVAFLFIAARLGHHLAVTLDQIDETLGAIAFGDSHTLDIESPEAAGKIHAELTRSRRHDRPLTVTVLSPTAEALDRATESASLEVDRAVQRRYVYGKLARAVGDQLRRNDVMFEHRASGRLFILSPETDADGSRLLKKRVIEASHHVGVPTEAGSASFPDDAIGIESLMEIAENELASRIDPARHLRAVEQGESA